MRPVSDYTASVAYAREGAARDRGSPLRGSICFESFAHANDFVSPVAQSRIEPDGLRVGLSDLQVDLGTPGRMQQSLNFTHHAASESLPLPLRRYRQVVDPTTMSFVSSHRGGDDRVIGESNQEQ